MDVQWKSFTDAMANQPLPQSTTAVELDRFKQQVDAFTPLATDHRPELARASAVQPFAKGLDNIFKWHS